MSIPRRRGELDGVGKGWSRSDGYCVVKGTGYQCRRSTAGEATMTLPRRILVTGSGSYRYFSLHGPRVALFFILLIFFLLCSLLFSLFLFYSSLLLFFFTVLFYSSPLLFLFSSFSSLLLSSRFSEVLACQLLPGVHVRHWMVVVCLTLAGDPVDCLGKAFNPLACDDTLRFTRHTCVKLL